MKTTIEIADALFTEAKSVARRDETTLRALVEEGLRKILEERKRRPAFRLRDASVRGNGLQGDVTEGDWESILRMAYEGRGG